MSKLRTALLPFTIRNAARLPFYANFWRGVDVDNISSPKELPLLPTLSKERYRESFMFDPTAIQDCSYITHTSGTTGAVTWRHRSAAEATIINQLFGQAAETQHEGLALVIRYDRHGMAMPMPGYARYFP